MTPLQKRGDFKENPIDIDLLPEFLYPATEKRQRESSLAAQGEFATPLKASSFSSRHNYDNITSTSRFADIHNWLQKNGHFPTGSTATTTGASSQHVDVKAYSTREPAMTAMMGIANGADKPILYGHQNESPGVLRSCSAPNGSAEKKIAIPGISNGYFKAISTQPASKSNKPANAFKDDIRISLKYKEDMNNTRKRSTASSAAVSRAASSTGSTRSTNKCAMCHGAPKSGDGVLLTCWTCSYSFHKMCQEVTREELAKLGDRWQCSICRKKRQGGANANPKAVKRANSGQDKHCGVATSSPHKKARLASPERTGHERRYTSGELPSSRQNKPGSHHSVASNSKREPERRSGPHDHEHAAQATRRTLPWQIGISSTPDNRDSMLYVNSATKAKSSSATISKVVTQGIQRSVSLPSQEVRYGAQSKESRPGPVAICSSPPTNLNTRMAPALTVLHGRNFAPAVKSASTVSEVAKLIGGSRSSQSRKDDIKIDGTSSMPEIVPGVTGKAASNTVPTSRGKSLEDIDNAVVTLKARVSADLLAALPRSYTTKFNQGKADWSKVVEADLSQELGTTNNAVKSCHGNVATFKPVSVAGCLVAGNNASSGSLLRTTYPKGHEDSEAVVQQRPEAEEEERNDSTNEPRQKASVLDTTLISESMPTFKLDSRIQPWLEKVNHEATEAGLAQSLDKQIGSGYRLAIPEVPSKDQVEHELSEESMSIDTSSSPKYEAVEKCLYITDPLSGIESNGITDSRHADPTRTETNAPKSDVSKLNGDGTDRESSPPYSPPPAEEYHAPVKRCYKLACDRKPEVFVEHLWCKVHAEEHKKSRPPARESGPNSKEDSLSPLFWGSESTSPNTLSTLSGEESDATDLSAGDVGRKAQKSKRIRSEKGKQAHSKKSPTKTLQELEKENSHQRDALKRHAKRVSELERELKQMSLLIATKDQDLKAAKDAVFQATERGERPLKDISGLRQESNHRESQMRVDETDRSTQELQLSVSAEREIQELRREIENLKAENKSACEEACKQDNDIPARAQNGRYGNMAFDIQDPTSGADDGHRQNATMQFPIGLRKRYGRKDNFPRFTTQNVGVLDIHKERQNCSRPPLKGDVSKCRTASAIRGAPNLGAESSSDGLNSDYTSTMPGKTLRKRVKEGRMTFEEFLGLPQNMIPYVKNGASGPLTFRPAILTRTGKVDRNAPSYPIGRDIPGELRT